VRQHSHATCVDNYEISAELPGLDEKDLDVSVVNGCLTIKGEEQDEKEEKKIDVKAA
jgi:HSP20 family protein